MRQTHLAPPDLTNTGLTDGVNAQIIDGDEDVMAYTWDWRNNLSSFAAYAGTNQQ
ncbi:MAG: hypothetical protein R3C02_13605 [Planctomycetaceae bacterium]